MRIVTSTADLAYPYVLFDFIDYEKNYISYNLMGCIKVSNTSTYSLKLNFNELKNYSLNNWKNIRNSSDNNRISKITDTNSQNCKLILFTIKSFYHFKFDKNFLQFDI